MQVAVARSAERGDGEKRRRGDEGGALSLAPLAPLAPLLPFRHVVYASTSLRSTTFWFRIQMSPPSNSRLRSVVIIPARFASTRLPRKMLLSETGKPLIQ